MVETRRHGRESSSAKQEQVLQEADGVLRRASAEVQVQVETGPYAEHEGGVAGLLLESEVGNTAEAEQHALHAGPGDQDEQPGSDAAGTARREEGAHMEQSVLPEPERIPFAGFRDAAHSA